MKSSLEKSIEAIQKLKQAEEEKLRAIERAKPSAEQRIKKLFPSILDGKHEYHRYIHMWFFWVKGNKYSLILEYFYDKGVPTEGWPASNESHWMLYSPEGDKLLTFSDNYDPSELDIKTNEQSLRDCIIRNLERKSR